MYVKIRKERDIHSCNRLVYSFVKDIARILESTFFLSSVKLVFESRVLLAPVRQVFPTTELYLQPCVCLFVCCFFVLGTFCDHTGVYLRLLFSF